MKVLSLFGVLAVSFFSSNLASAQSIPPANYSVRLNRVTQIGFFPSGTTTGFLLKGTKIIGNTTTDIYKLSGVSASGVSENCLNLASKLNTETLSSTSNFQINFTSEIASGSGVAGQPSNYDYQRVVIKSCYLTSN